MKHIPTKLLLEWIEECRAAKLYTISLDQILIKIKELEKEQPSSSPDLEILRLKTGWDKDKLAIIEYQDEIFQLGKKINSHLPKASPDMPYTLKHEELDDMMSRITAEKKGNTHIKDCLKCKGKNLIKIVLHPIIYSKGFSIDISKCTSCGHQAMDVEEFFPKYKSI